MRTRRTTAATLPTSWPRSLTAWRSTACTGPSSSARDFTILAGHGLVEAAKTLGWEEIAVVRLDLGPDDPEAIKILTGDNELGRLAEVDDRILSEHLKLLADQGMLMGTGFDDQMLASLLYATRPASEIASQGAAEHWVGMPDFGQADAPSKIVVQFATPEDRDRFMAVIGVEVVAKKTLGTWSIWWPPRDKEDLSSFRFE